MSNETSEEIKGEKIVGEVKNEETLVKEDGSKLDHSRSFDMNDQNELDYEELDVPKDTSEIKKTIVPEENDDGAIDDESDGEVKSPNNSDGEIVDAEETNVPKEPEIPEEEEDGEINDGEKVKKAFIPRVLCKYYQRGKCTWGRTCKFLHPGVNDTGNYSFLEFQDPNAKVYEQTAPIPTDLDKVNSMKEAELAEPAETETAWERGLRHAREMKEKAKARKLLEKETFEDKKMNLSLKEFENEKENDERYFNVEKMPTNDSEEDEDLHLFAQSGRLNNERRSSSNQAYRSSAYNSNERGNQYQSNRYSDDKRSSQYNRQNDYRHQDKSEGSMGRRQSPFMGGNRGRADDWHDPWDRSNKKKNVQRRDRSNSYSSSGSDSRSRSRSHSGSRSSYSSRSSRSYSSGSSDSSRSGSASPKKKGSKQERQSRQMSRSDKSKGLTNPKQLTSDLKKKIESLKKASVKPLPGRQISDVSLKKAGLEGDKSSGKRNKKNSRSRSRSNSSISSYESSDSKSDDDDDDFSNDDSDSYSDNDNDDYDARKSSKKNLKQQDSKGLKRSANDSKLGTDPKKSKSDKSDKKQMIKDELKRLESALKKKNAAK